MAFGGGSALVQLVALGLPAAGSVEAPIPIRIVFDAPEDCSTEEAFYQGVRSRTDRVRRAEAGETGTELGVRVTKTSGKVHGELDLIGEHGESDRRVVDGETCSEVVEALSLTAALALDPTARVSPAPGAPASGATTTQPAPCPAPCPPPPLVPTYPNSFELGLHARLALAKVVTPEWSLGGMVFAALRPVAWLPSGPSFGFGVGYLANTVGSSSDDANPATRLTTVMLRVCPLRWGLASSLSVEPCVVGKGGWLDAEGRGLSNPDTVQRSWWSLGAEAVLELTLGWGLSLALAPSFDVPLAERRFTTGEPPEPAGETPTVSPGVSVGIGYYFQ